MTRYLELVTTFPLRPLRSDEDLGRAIEIVDSLIDRDELGRDERDYLDVLSDLVEKYEDIRYPDEPIPEAAMLRHLIDARGVTPDQVEADTGIDRRIIQGILDGNLGSSKGQAATLAKYFHVSPATFFE